MSKPEQVIIDIDDATGDVKVEAEGFTGPACELATKVFRDALGASVDNKRKAEFTQQPTQQQQKVTQK